MIGGVLLFVAWFVIDSLLFANPDMPFLRARQMLCFPIGVLLAKKSNIDSVNIERKMIGVLGATGIVFMALTQLEFVKSMPYIISNLLSLFTVMPLAGTVICISKLCPLITQSRISQLMGRYSFEIYLIHAFTLSVVSNDVFGILTFWLLTLCCAILLNRIVSKWRI